MSSTRKAVAQLLESGLSVPAIARELELASTTVSYHAGRLGTDSRPAQADVTDVPVTISRSLTRDEVGRLLGAGLSRADVAAQLGVSKSTVSYHARRLGHGVDERCARRYDWSAIQRYYDEGHGVRACMLAFGFSSAGWFEAVRRGAVVARSAATPVDRLFVEGTYRGRHNLKLRLIKEGLKDNRCERCGLAEWRGAPLTVALHHISGDRYDNRLQNLEFLCPNCHSQTENFAGRRRPIPSGEG